MNQFVNSLKVYLLWLTMLLVIAFTMKQLVEMLAVLIFLSCIIVPADRARISMIKAGERIPKGNVSWLYVISFSIIPFIFGVYSSSVGELPEGVMRANAVVLSIVFWGIFTFGLNALFFKNKAMWDRASRRITKHSSGQK